MGQPRLGALESIDLRCLLVDPEKGVMNLSTFHMHAKSKSGSPRGVLQRMFYETRALASILPLPRFDSFYLNGHEKSKMKQLIGERRV